jgi:hypothetical protein
MLQPKSCARPPQLPSFLLTLPPTAVCRCGGSANTRLRTGSSLTCVSQCPLGRQTLSWRGCSRGALLALSGPQCPRQSILAVSSSERLCGGSHMALHRGQSECMDAGENGHARPAAAAVSAAARCALILPPHACLPVRRPGWRPAGSSPAPLQSLQRMERHTMLTTTAMHAGRVWMPCPSPSLGCEQPLFSCSCHRCCCCWCCMCSPI